MSSYISLNAYSHRYKVSLKEIRKRIELKKIEFVFSDFEYLVKDKPFEQHYQLEKKPATILNEQEKIQKLTQRPEYQPTSADKCVMLPQHLFDVSNPSAARNHWASFEKYLTFQRRYGSII